MPATRMASAARSSSQEAEIDTKVKDIATRTIEIIASCSKMDEATITRDTQLDEIGVSSLELTEVVMDLEELFDIQIDLNASEAWDSLKNVGDIIDTIGKLVSAKG